MYISQVKQQAGILDCIGGTPLVMLKRVFSSTSIQLFGKLEMFNPGGSIKDRTAYNMVSRAIEEGKIDGRYTIIESTSGNMGIGLAHVCHYYGLKLILVTDPNINPLTEKILRTFQAKIVKVDQQDGKGGYLNTRLAKVQELLETTPFSFWPDQYHNFNNPLAHEKTYLEITAQLEKDPDYIFIPTSTCGTLRGFTESIKKYNACTKVIAVDAVGSVIFGDEPQPRLIPGMGASRSSDFLVRNQVWDVVHVSDKECIEGCRMLLGQESILAGGSSGAVIKAIQKNLSSFPSHATVVALLADSGERYLDTVYSDEWVKKHFNIRI